MFVQLSYFTDRVRPVSLKTVDTFLSKLTVGFIVEQVRKLVSVCLLELEVGSVAPSAVSTIFVLKLLNIE